jgi:hypothetical protein
MFTPAATKVYRLHDLAYLPNSDGIVLEKALCAMLSERRFFIASIDMGISPINSLAETSKCCRPAMDVHSTGNVPPK